MCHQLTEGTTSSQSLRSTRTGNHTKPPEPAWENMPIALVVVPLVLAGSVFGLIGFASQETEDMSPAETTMRLNK